MSDNVVQGPESWRANIRHSLEPDPAPSPDLAGGGGPPHDPGMEACVAVLEQIAKQTSETLAGIRADLAGIKTDLKTGLDATRDRHDRDFLLTFGAIIAVALGLAGLMAKGFKWL